MLCAIIVLSDLEAVFRLEDYLPPSVRPHYQALVKHVLEALQTIGVLRKDITESGTESSGKGFTPSYLETLLMKALLALARARKELSDFESQIKKKYKKLEGQKAILDKDWGSEWEWKKLDGTCLDKNTGEWVRSTERFISC